MSNHEQQPAVSFRHVSKRFMLHNAKPQTVLETFISTLKRQRPAAQELWAVRDLSFDIMPGESLGIIGRNGAGKSTLLKLVARILRPTSGEVSVNGRVSALLELGAGFHPDLTGRENIYLNGSVLGLSRQQIDASYQAIVDFSELGDFIDVPVKHYSSGMYMRLGFSVAIHVEPDVLLIDEILAVGDQAFQTKCVERIFELQRQGKTIIMVSHHNEIVRSICSHVLWMEHGEMQAAGPMRTVLGEYATYWAGGQHKERSREGAGFRWGTREIEMTGVRLCGLDGAVQDTFAPGSPVQVAIEYQVHRPVQQPHFDVTIFRADGLQVTAGQPFAAGPATGRLDGRGVVLYRLDHLPLVAGDYVMTVAVHDGRPEYAYDCHELAYPFTVTGPQQAQGGFVTVPAQWDWLPQVEEVGATLFKV